MGSSNEPLKVPLKEHHTLILLTRHQTDLIDNIAAVQVFVKLYMRRRLCVVSVVEIVRC